MLAGPRLTSIALLSLALSASAGVITRTTSPVTLALTKQYNLTETSKILQIDQARAKALIARVKGREKAQAAPFNVPAANQAAYYSTTVSMLRLSVGQRGSQECIGWDWQSAGERLVYHDLPDVLILTIFGLQPRCSSIPGARTPGWTTPSYHRRPSLLETSS